jgi:hypothetical protein
MMVRGLLDGLTDPEVMAEVERREYLVGRLVEQTGVTRNEARQLLSHFEAETDARGYELN